MAQQSPTPATTQVAGRASAGQRGSGPDGSGPARSVDEIQHDIESTRKRLAGTVDEIADRVKPSNVIDRAKAAAMAQVVDPSTGPRYDRIGIAVGIVLAVIGLRVWRSRR